VRERERLPVHRHRHHRAAVLVEQRGQGCPCGEVVGAGRLHGVRARLDPGLAKQVTDRDADPRGVSEVLPADGVRHAGQRDPPLDEPAGEEVLEGQLELRVDHPVDPQPPAVEGDVGHPQRGVDAVEVGVAREVRRDARYVERGTARHGGRRHLGAGDAQAGPGGGGRRAAVHPADQPAGGRYRADRQGRLHEGAPVERGGQLVAFDPARRRRGPRARPRRPQQHHEREAADQHQREGGDQPETRPRGGGPVGHRRDRRDGAEHEEGTDRHARAAQPEHPDPRGEQRHGDEDCRDQDRLVGGPEGLDGPLLQRPRGRVDHPVGHRQHRRGDPVEQRGGRLGHRHGGHPRQQSRPGAGGERCRPAGSGGTWT